MRFIRKVMLASMVVGIMGASFGAGYELSYDKHMHIKMQERSAPIYSRNPFDHIRGY